jgi:hypothetical protein
LALLVRPSLVYSTYARPTHSLANLGVGLVDVEPLREQFLQLTTDPFTDWGPSRTTLFHHGRQALFFRQPAQLSQPLPADPEGPCQLTELDLLALRQYDQQQVAGPAFPLRVRPYQHPADGHLHDPILALPNGAHRTEPPRFPGHRSCNT